MKTATGELNITVIVIMAISAMAAIFYVFIWPNISNSLKLGQACDNAISGDFNSFRDEGITCVQADDSYKITCYYVSKPGTFKRCNFD